MKTEFDFDREVQKLDAIVPKGYFVDPSVVMENIIDFKDQDNYWGMAIQSLRASTSERLAEAGFNPSDYGLAH